jgi:hypothetical protein
LPQWFEEIGIWGFFWFLKKIIYFEIFD